MPGCRLHAALQGGIIVDGTALHEAVEYGHVEVVKVLLQRKANPEIQRSVCA